MVNKILFLLRKIYIILFTKMPFRVSGFNDIFKDNAGIKVDLPENLTSIFIHQQGKPFYYSGEIFNYEQPLKHRQVEYKYRFKTSGKFKEPDRKAYSISDACIFSQLGIIYCQSNRYFIAKSAKEWTVDLKYSKYTNAINLAKK